MKELPGELIYRMYFLKNEIKFFDFYVLEQKALNDAHIKKQRLFFIYKSPIGECIICKN